MECLISSECIDTVIHFLSVLKFIFPQDGSPIPYDFANHLNPIAITIPDTILVCIDAFKYRAIMYDEAPPAAVVA